MIYEAMRDAGRQPSVAKVKSTRESTNRETIRDAIAIARETTTTIYGK